LQSESSILEKDTEMQIMEMLAFCSQSTWKDTILTTQVQHKIILQSSSYKKRMLYWYWSKLLKIELPTYQEVFVVPTIELHLQR
jgi:hypothetical protein